MSYQTILPGAIKVLLPEIQQPNDYWCGPGTALSVAAYFGVGPERIEEIAKAVKSTEKGWNLLWRAGQVL